MIFEKIRERLEETNIHDIQMVVREVLKKYGFPYESVVQDEIWYELDNLSINNHAINIINQVEVEYNNGWIPCSERLPETNDAVNIVWVNRKPEPYYADIKDKPFTATGHYHKGKWYWYSVVCKDYLDEYGTSGVDEVDEDIDIIAWQPLPQPPKGE